MGGRSSRLVSDAGVLAQDGKEWDYIIVGSGPAGCVLANRLSADSNIRVLLIEAGSNNADEPLSRIPMLSSRLYKTAADWNYSTPPQPELKGRSLQYPRGKLLGGSTSINAMMYQRAPPDDLDKWESEGAIGWGAETIYKYYRKSEKFTPSPLHKDTTHEHRGDSGFLQTKYPRPHVMSGYFVDSCQSAGIPHVSDFNTPNGPLGVSHLTTMIDKKDQRSSAATAYLPNSVLARPNLTVAVLTRVTRVLVEPISNTESDLKCTGVEVANSTDGPRYRLRSKKEVILCSGSIGTPQILMCSGIGPEEQLRAAGIPILLKHEQVGQNMWDHLSAFCAFRAKHSVDYYQPPLLQFWLLARYLLGLGGPLTSNGGEVAAFIRLNEHRSLWATEVSKMSDVVPDTTSGPRTPDFELIGVPATFIQHGAVLPPPGNMSYSIGTVLLCPVSKGYVGVKSGNIFDSAIVEPNYFDDKVDLEAFVRAVRVTLRIAHAKPLADHLIFPGPNPDKNSIFWLADADPETLTDEDLVEWLRRNGETLYHPVGTARIGTSPETGVVDANLKVFGVQNLRIADASVFPTQIAAHTSATVIAIGERLSDIILSAA